MVYSWRALITERLASVIWHCILTVTVQQYELTEQGGGWLGEGERGVTPHDRPGRPVPDSSRREWERPGAFEVASGVHRIPLPLPADGLRAVNVYAVQDGRGLVLIDSGWALAESRKQLEAALAAIGHDLGDVSRFLVTHAHRDHYTQAVAVRRLFGTRVALGSGEAPTLREIRSTAGQFPPRLLGLLRSAGAGALAQQLASTAGAGDTDLGEWADPDEWLPDGAAITLGTRTLQVIATPGHTRGHLVFHDPGGRLLFAGDHVLPHITPSIGFEAAPSDRPLSDYLASLEVVGALADAALLPAHGPVQASTSARVAELIEHHRARLDATLAAVGQAGSTAAEVAGRLGWTRRAHRLADLDVLNQMLAVNETVAHLDVLAERGAVRIEEKDGVRYYVP
jgi:glyoxylase-like metal-dependent hydrolase (beta-lactamase superfamily II)